jgi:hypothetical protein
MPTSKIVHRRASFANIEHVGRTIEILQPDDNKDEFWVAVPSMAGGDLVSQDNSNREIKAILGEDSNLVKFTTSRAKRAINAIPLADFGTVCAKLAFKGNTAAQECIDA